jgi:tol-pal system protein YbgF
MARWSLLLLCLAGPGLSGCATRGDVRELQNEMHTMRTSQEALLQEIRQEIHRQNAMVLDSLTNQEMRLRGDLANRLVQMERQLIQIQELTGQGQQNLNQLRQQLRAQEEAMRAATLAGAGGGNPAAPPADELLTTARAALDRGSFATARAGFEEFLAAYPQHPATSSARLLVGESHEKAGERQPALRAYEQVVELHPNSTEAPTALYRAALIEIAQGNRTRARTMLTQLTTAYPRSPEVNDARARLRQLQ